MIAGDLFFIKTYKCPAVKHFKKGAIRRLYMQWVIKYTGKCFTMDDA